MTEKTTNWAPEELAAIHREQRRFEPPPRPEPEWPWMGHQCPYDEHCEDCVDQAYDEGAAVAFGIIGMALAIRERPRHWTEECLLCGR